MPKRQFPQQIILFIVGVLTTSIFVLDIYTPLGIADAELYGIPVLLTLWLPTRRATLLATAGAIPLVMLGGYFSPQGDVTTWVVMVNRFMALLVILGIALLVLQRKTMEAELRRSESRLAEAQRITRLGSWERDIVHDRVYWSEEVYRIFGVDPLAFTVSFTSFMERVHPDDRAALKAALNVTLQQRVPYALVYRIAHPNGGERVVFARGAANYDAQGKALSLIGTVQDITERRRLEQDLQEAHDKLESTVAERTAQLLQANRLLKEEILQHERTEAALAASKLRLRTVISGAPVVLFMLDAQGVFQLVEGRGLTGLGLQSEELAGQSIFTVCADTPQVLVDARRALAGENVASITQFRDNWFDWRYSPLHDARGAVAGAIGVATDITAQKLAEQSRLEVLRVQRDTLVREVHHRIKNNLQGVIGLLRQQSLTHAELRPILEQAIAQVHSVAIVHGLSSEKPGAEIMLCDMLRAISASLNKVSRDGVPLLLDLAIVKPIQLAKDEAVPIALILNELMTNAVKHRTAPGAAPPASVRLRGDCESAQITVSNAGALPPDFSLAERRGTGTGLNLVLALLPHSGATLALTQDADTVTARMTVTPPVICSVVADDAA